MTEIWKDIPDYEGLYQASNLGRIKSLKYGKERILKSGFSKSGYLLVVLSKNGKTKNFSVHRLVWESFNGKTDLQIDHINAIKIDNALSNLQALSNRQNIIKYYLTKRKTSQYTGVSKLNDGRKKLWVAAKYINGKQISTYHYTELDAYNAYLNFSE